PHIDGLADTAYGYGAPNAARALQIMRDHAVGSYGLVAVFFDLAIKTAATAALTGKPGGLLFLVAAGALSRSAGVVIGALAPHARAGEGLGTLLAGLARPLPLPGAGVGAAVGGGCAPLPGAGAAGAGCAAGGGVRAARAS